MKRRNFNQGAIAASVAAFLAACGGGGGGGGGGGASPPVGGGGVGTDTGGGGVVGGDGVGVGEGGGGELPPVPRNLVAMGTNFSGMEWAEAGLRVSPRTIPNVDYTVPRDADVVHLAANGFGLNRLPIRWEMLQPMLVDTQANAQARAIIGEPGAFHEAYARSIDRVLEAHAAVGARCVIDLHNYCRYKDFAFQGDGSVRGLVRPDDGVLYAYTTDPSQAFYRIFATAPGASLRPAAFADFWRRAAERWKDHPGFGGYGLMNEPYDLPPVGGTQEIAPNGQQDLFIWPTFARAAIEAIRAVDPQGPVYVMGNNFGGAMYIGPEWNPAWPLTGYDNIIYDVHAYVDAYNNGGGWDWELEVAKNYVAGVGPGAMDLDTGLNRMRVATDWAREHGTRLALTETAMPFDDPRFQEAFRRMIRHSWEQGVAPIQSWMGGSHWPIRNYPINHVPNWYQHRTMEALVAGEMKGAAGVDNADLFDAGGGDASGGPVTITVFARGNLAQPVTVNIRADGGATLSKTSLVIPAGPNGQDSYTCTVPAGGVATIVYESPGRDVPPPRTVYAVANPVALAATSLPAAAGAILARRRAARWDLAQGYNDYVEGARPAAEGQYVRAVADTGWASSPLNAMEMVCAFNTESPGSTAIAPPVMRIVGGRRGSDHSSGTAGLWCKKWVPGGPLPDPSNVIPFGLAQPHFMIVALTMGATYRNGPVFQASFSGGTWMSELAFWQGHAQAHWRDTDGQGTTIQAPQVLQPGQFAVVSLTHAPGAQQLRVQSQRVATASLRLAAAPLDSLVIGMGVLGNQLFPGFNGVVHAVLAGPGVPTDAELQVLEQYLEQTAGLA